MALTALPITIDQLDEKEKELINVFLDTEYIPQLALTYSIHFAPSRYEYIKIYKVSKWTLEVVHVLAESKEETSMGYLNDLCFTDYINYLSKFKDQVSAISVSAGDDIDYCYYVVRS